MRLYNDNEVMAMLRELINMPIMEYILFWYKIRMYCPWEYKPKAELIMRVIILIRMKIGSQG